MKKTLARTAPILDAASRFETQMNWMLFVQEQEALLAKPGIPWVPGDPLYERPYGGHILGLQTIRYMMDLFDDNTVADNAVEDYRHCEACDVHWRGHEGCWICGEGERPEFPEYQPIDVNGRGERIYMDFDIDFNRYRISDGSFVLQVPAHVVYDGPPDLIHQMFHQRREEHRRREMLERRREHEQQTMVDVSRRVNRHVESFMDAMRADMRRMYNENLRHFMEEAFQHMRGFGVSVNDVRSAMGLSRIVRSIPPAPPRIERFQQPSREIDLGERFPQTFEQRDENPVPPTPVVRLVNQINIEQEGTYRIEEPQLNRIQILGGDTNLEHRRYWMDRPATEQRRRRRHD